VKKILVLFALFAMFATTACKKETGITAKMTWVDKDYFDLHGKWKIALYEGTLGFHNADDYNAPVVETKNIKVGDSETVFTVTIGSYEGYTLVAFFDLNGNGKFDDGENCKVNFEVGVSKGEDESFDLEIEY